MSIKGQCLIVQQGGHLPGIPEQGVILQHHQVCPLRPKKSINVSNKFIEHERDSMPCTHLILIPFLAQYVVLSIELDVTQ